MSWKSTTLGLGLGISTGVVGTAFYNHLKLSPNKSKLTLAQEFIGITASEAWELISASQEVLLVALSDHHELINSRIEPLLYTSLGLISFSVLTLSLTSRKWLRNFVKPLLFCGCSCGVLGIGIKWLDLKDPLFMFQL